jgi:PE-PPE domain
MRTEELSRRPRVGRKLDRWLSVTVLVGVLLVPLTHTARVVSIPVRLVDDSEPVNALMVGGTFQPTPTEPWMASIITDYIDPATGGNYTPVAVTTPETVPLDLSLQTGVADLQAAMQQQEMANPNAPFLIEGYSQSGVLVTDEKEVLATMEAHGQQIPNVTLLMLGDPNRPNGGLFERFDGGYIPGAEVTATGAEPTTTGIDTIDISGQYDPASDFPQYPVNLVSDLNSLIAGLYVHGDYGGLDQSVFPGANFEPLPGGDYDYASQYVLGATEIVKQIDGDTTFYFVPDTNLPLLDPLLSLGVPESWVNVFQPFLQVIVEAGYDRSIPFGDPTAAELIPTIDPATFSLELGNGVVQGANNFLELFGAQLPDYNQLESFFSSAEAWSETNVGVPYDQVVNAINTGFDPITSFDHFEGVVGQDIQTLLTDSGIQQELITPFFGDLVSGIEYLEAMILPAS